MKILLIAPYVNLYFDRSAKSVVREDFIPSTALLCLGAMLRENNYEPVLLDLNNTEVHSKQAKYRDYCKKILCLNIVHNL